MPDPAAPPPPAPDGLDPLLRQAFAPPPPPARTAPDAAERIAHYRLIREIGRGGQGVVHLAEDTRLRRRVAIKVLAAHAGLSPEARARFEREARIASRLEHPGICGILDLGFHDGAPYVVLPYLEGETLAQKLQATRLAGAPGLRIGAAGPAAVPELLRLFEQAAVAVHAAHEAGVVHRDLKPGNLMVTPRGDPVVLDFGQARDAHGDETAATQSGGLSGTPAYMSP
jgi:serine/threonine protein kinase